MIQRCKQCGQVFELSESEIAFYNRRGMDLPRRCADCRKKNRNQRNKTDDAVPFWKQGAQDAEKKRHITSFIVLLAVVVSVVAGGTIFAVMRLKPATKQPPDSSAALIVPETTTTIPETTIHPATETITASITETETEAESVTVPETTAPPAKEVTYYLNTYRKKFHKPNCPSVKQMNWRNRQAFYGTREEAIAQGYSPCHNCNP